MKLTEIALLVGLVSTAAAGAAYTWDNGLWPHQHAQRTAVTALSQQVADNARYRQLQQWRVLSARKKSRRLTIEEHIEWCAIGVALGIIKVCPAR